MTAPGPDGPVTTRYGYDAAMNNTSTIDPLGRVTTYTYDALTRETASYSGQVIDSGTAGYADSGSAWTPGATDKVGGTYDTTTSVAGAATAAAAWTFIGLTPGDSYQLFTSWTAASGNSNASDVPFSISYTDAEGNAQQTTEPVDESAPPAAGWSFSGQNFASLGAFTAGPDGTIVVQLSNSTGTAGQTVVADSVFLRRVQAMSQTSYDPASNVSSTIDALGNVTASTYDDLDQETAGYQGQVDNSAGTSWTFSNLTPNSQLSYDVYGYSASGTLTGAGYTVGVYPLGTPDPAVPSLGPGWYKLGTVTVSAATSTLTVDGPATSAVCLLQQTAATAYDPAGNVAATTDALGNTTSYQYNAMGQTIAVVQPMPGTGDAGPPVTRSVYDADGELVQLIDALGNSTEYSYNALGELACTTDPMGATTSYSYDTDGNELTETDPDGNVTTYGYNGLNQMTSQRQSITLAYGESPTTVTTNYDYDADGDLVQETDADGQAMVFAYDSMGRETGETWYPTQADATLGIDASNAISFTYDADGELLGAQDDDLSNQADSSSYTYTYNSLGESTSVDNNGSGISGTTGTAGVPDVLLASSYDADGNRTQLAATIGGTADFLNNYSYDSQNQEVQVTQGGGSANDLVDGKLVGFAYNADGELQSIDRLQGASLTSPVVATSSYGYDNDGRLTSLSHTVPNNTTAGTTYGWTYDADSEVTSFTNSNSAYNATESIANLQYDADGQLIGATPVGAPNAANSLANPSYDSNGNATGINGGTTTTTKIGDGNTILFDGTYSYNYDADGNMVARWKSSVAEAQSESNDSQITLYTWDNRGRLTTVTYYSTYAHYTESSPDQTVTYTYDMFNNLIGRTVTTYGMGGTMTTQRYVFDGTNMVLAFDGSCNLTDRYLWGPAVDQVLADEQFTPTSGQTNHLPGPGTALDTYWLLGDNQNSVRDVVDDSGALVEHVAYSPFGQQVTISGSAASVFGYTGTYTDPSTGLQLHGIRWYDPTSQRWLSQDPSGLGPDSNPYRYCANDPTDGTDPSGRNGGIVLQQAFQPRSTWDMIMDNPPVSKGYGVATWWESGNGANSRYCDIGTAQVQPSTEGPTLYGDITVYSEYGGGTLTQQQARAAGVLSTIPANARGAGESKADYIKRLIAAARICPKPKITVVYGPPTRVNVWTPPVNALANAIVTYRHTVYTKVNGKIVSETPEEESVTGTAIGGIVSSIPPEGWGGVTESEAETEQHEAPPEPVLPINVGGR